MPVSTRSRKSTKNLPYSEWLTAWFGPVRGEGPNLRFGYPRRCDGHFLHSAFCMPKIDSDGRVLEPSFLEELEARGYDISTLEFRIKRKEPA